MKKLMSLMVAVGLVLSVANASFAQDEKKADEKQGKKKGKKKKAEEK